MNATSTHSGTTPRLTEADVRVGLVLREPDLLAWQGRLGDLASAAARAGIDHLTVGDHVSFNGGHGADGLIQATALLAAHPALDVQTGIYLLALRHPATVARQLATINVIAPGRLTFGIGVGGDDPSELALCGIDPRTRGARTEEALQLVKAFMTGEDVTFHGHFFTVDATAIRPAIEPRIPILVGGRSDAAVRRTGRLGDGWIGVWVSARRFGEVVETIDAAADEAGRGRREWRHTMQLWAGLDATREAGLARVQPVMEREYQMPFERFARYTPCGGPDDVTAFLEPYVDAGCRRFNFVPEADGLEAAIESIGAVKTLLGRFTPAQTNRR